MLLDSALYFEECFVSGDCVEDDLEFGWDMVGRDLGVELADVFVSHVETRGITSTFAGATEEEIADAYGVDLSTCMSVRIEGPEQLLVGESGTWYADADGVEPIGYEWEILGEIVATGPELFLSFDEPGERTVTAFATDGRLREGRASISVSVTTEPVFVPEYVVLRAVNYPGQGYFAIRPDTILEDDPPMLLSGLNCGGASDTERVQWELVSEERFDSSARAAEILCPSIYGFYRPTLATHCRKMYYGGEEWPENEAGYDSVIRDVCEPQIEGRP